MGLIQFSGFDAVNSPDVTALNRLSGQAGSEGELYQPLDEAVDPLVALPLPELVASDVAVDETESEQSGAEGDPAEQLQAFTNVPPLFVRVSDADLDGFRVSRTFARAEGSTGGLQVVDNKLPPSLRALMGSATTLPEQEVMPRRETVSAAAEQALSTLLAKSNGQTGVLPGRFTLPVMAAGFDAANVPDTAVVENRLPDARQLAVGQLAATPWRPADYQWAPVRLSDNQSQWGQQLVSLLQDKVELQVNQQVKQAHIRLDPPELGRLELTVKLDGDRLNVQLNVTNPAVRDAMIQSMERLRMSLAPHHAGGVEVNVGQGGEQGQQERWQQEKILAGRRQWLDEPESQWGTMHDWLNTLV
ncbi:flagellar hook-length control protein FliK [Aeromonas veronii]|uniref:flagellar hook-length control protein FliK n=1 Tax=Aeromonas veronii TaxID=654 RepID=UPI000F5F14ED|nr:flagellar hook-length control protein FliK [Aeromonas veronii]RRA94398.1 flagellar hook-length control protein FliK [Aeromonas veronii bv. sobria]